jgi:HEAT repeats
VKKLFWIGLAVGLGLLAARLIITTLALREPVYEGRRLSVWLADLDTDKPQATRRRAAAAVRHIGTNAVPVLLEDLGARSSPMQTAVVGWVRRHPWIKLRVATSAERRSRAYLACRVLAPLAQPIIPGLIQLLKEDETAPTAGNVLLLFGADAVGPLTRALTSRNLHIRYAAASLLGAFGSGAAPAVSALVRVLDDQDYRVRVVAALSLDEIHAAPDAVVPALIARLSDPNAIVRRTSAEVLGRFGPEAATAIPALLRETHDSEESVRRAAVGALKQIEPGLPPVTGRD